MASDAIDLEDTRVFQESERVGVGKIAKNEAVSETINIAALSRIAIQVFEHSHDLHIETPEDVVSEHTSVCLSTFN